MTRKLIAEKSHKYGTRRLVAGDEYDATDMHAKVLVGIRKARYAPAPSLEQTAPVKPVASVMQPQKAETKAVLQQQTGVSQERTGEVHVADELDRLRREAQHLGIEVDGRWGDIRLKHEIMQARSK